MSSLKQLIKNIVNAHLNGFAVLDQYWIDEQYLMLRQKLAEKKFRCTTPAG